MYNSVFDNQRFYNLEDIVLAINDISFYMLIITLLIIIVYIHFEYQFYLLNKK